MTNATAQVTRTIHAPADRVWEALTTPELIADYMFGAKVESDWEVGAPIRMTGEYGGKTYHDKGEIRSFEPERRLSYTHWSDLSGAADAPENYHVVTYDLEPQGEATRVTLTQSNLDGTIKDSDVKMKAEFEKTWTSVLEGLERTVAN